MPDHRSDDDDQEEGNETADEAADDVHDALDEVLQRGGVVDRGGQDGGPADLLRKALDAAAAHVRDVVMGWDTHHVAGVHQLQDPLVVQGGMEVDGVNPLAHDVVRGAVQVRDDGVAVDFFFVRGFAQDNARDPVIREVVTSEAVQDLLCRVRVHHHQHAGLLLFPAVVVLQEKFPEEAGQVAEDDVQDEGGEEDDAGIGGAGLDGKDKDHRDGEDIETVLYRLDKLDIVPAAGHVVQGVVQDKDQGVHEDQKEAEAAIDGSAVGPGVLAEQDRQNERQLQTEFIEQDEVKMLGPALGISLIHCCGPSFPAVIVSEDDYYFVSTKMNAIKIACLL